MSIFSDQSAEAFAEDERRAVLKLGPKKFAELMTKAERLVKKANTTGALTEREREEFLKLPLIIRIKAADNVSLENY